MDLSEIAKILSKEVDRQRNLLKRWLRLIRDPSDEDVFLLERETAEILGETDNSFHQQEGDPPMHFLASNLCPYDYEVIWYKATKEELLTEEPVRGLLDPDKELLNRYKESEIEKKPELELSQEDYELLTLQYLDKCGGEADSIEMKEWIKSKGHKFRFSRLKNAQDNLVSRGIIKGGWDTPEYGARRWVFWRIEK